MVNKKCETKRDGGANHNLRKIFTPLGASNHTDQEREQNDYYATDPKALEMLLEFESFGHYVWEPACGEGHLSTVLKNHGYNVKSSDLINRGYEDTEIADFLHAPQFENRSFESFNRRNGRNGGYDPKRIEMGVINSCGIGYPLHFVNVRENGELLRPDCVTDMLAVIHGENGKMTISETFNLHSLRNTFVSRAREKGMREHMIAAIAGHKNEETTEGYMRVSAGEFFYATNHIRKLNAYEQEDMFKAENFDFQQYIQTLDKKSLKVIFDQVSNALYGV